ncbi:MAG: P1 family peptidase [Clostridiales bacterium]|nr:P1 family peptidase [Clostridiales bacterium]
MDEIRIQDVSDVRIGQVEDRAVGTGCTVFVKPDGMRAGLNVSGGGPASRESTLLDPLTAADLIHGITISGGSAFGLSAASGVMRYLEEQNIGFDVGVTKVPLVAQSSLFDLTVGDASVRPDEQMGYEACRIAMEAQNYKDGNFGAGCGATVGKIAGMDYCMKTGIGSYAVDNHGLKVGAVVALNALGDIFDWKTGKQIAGLLKEDKKTFRSSPQYIEESIKVVSDRFAQLSKMNTTLAVLITNAHFEKPQLCKIAGMCQDGLARSIRPVHTSFDGDTVYAVSAGDLKADQEVVGTLAAEVISEAIIRAVTSAESAYGFPAARDL